MTWRTKLYESQGMTSKRVLTWILQHGRDYLNQSNGSLVYRRQLAVEQAFIRSIRTDRKPLSSSNVIHDQIDAGIKLSKCAANRSNCLFVTSNPKRTTPYSGKLFVVIPANGFHYTWSTQVIDAFTAGRSGAEWNDIWQCDDGSLSQAIDSENEIMISGPEALLVHSDVWSKQQITQQLRAQGVHVGFATGDYRS